MSASFVRPLLPWERTEPSPRPWSYRRAPRGGDSYELVDATGYAFAMGLGEHDARMACERVNAGETQTIEVDRG